MGIKYDGYFESKEYKEFMDASRYLMNDIFELTSAQTIDDCMDSYQRVKRNLECVCEFRIRLLEAFQDEQD